MISNTQWIAAGCAALMMAAGGVTSAAAGQPAAAVDTARIIGADAEPGNWMAHGRTYSEQRFSPLDTINTDTVGDLGLAWHVDLNTRRGVEATPLIVDGVMYVTGPWGVAWALDAKTGEELWFHDPQVDKAWGQKGCCDTVNRGAAVYDGSVFLASFDGYLWSLDAKTGAVNWKVNTIDRTKSYTITGAPRVVDGKVFIGNGGAEYGVRGYFSAYDTKTGDMLWRFYTVPNAPDRPQEGAHLEAALDTWDPDGAWTVSGGGGTVWDSYAYDPELGLLYVGVGNGSPWSRDVRSPAGGDNLYLSSILAVNAETGELVWHYQTTPADNWDYTATQHMILAELEIDGTMRDVIMQAPKNGFFYVLDRQTGELLKADPYVPVNWASHVDLTTGRPVETGAGVYTDAPALVFPGPIGGHNWHPMAYSQRTNLVYIPALEVPALFEAAPEGQERREGWWNTGTVSGNTNDVPPELVKGRVLAWDPVKAEEVWRYEHWGPWNGGLLATAGGLVFQGGGDGLLRAFKDDTGEILWTAPGQTGIIAPPVTYEIDGEQYLSVAVGWGGVAALVYGRGVRQEANSHLGRVLTFKLGADGTLPPKPGAAEIPAPPAPIGTDEDIRAGLGLYNDYCAACHGVGAVGGGVIPDLRHSTPEVHGLWTEIVLEGMLAANGMASFADWLTPEDLENIRAYVIHRAHEGDIPDGSALPVPADAPSTEEN